MSYFSFNLIGNALDAAQEGSTVTSDNIANVGTPGASRQVAVVSEAIPISGSPFYSSHIGTPGTRGEGAVVNQISRIHQDSYDGLFRGAVASQAFYTAQQQELGTLQSNFGEPNNGINSAYASFQTTISNVASQPTDVSSREAVLGAAGVFAAALNTAGNAINSQESQVLSDATSGVQQVNTLIDQIAGLNGQIRSLTIAGDNPNTYLDQRDHAIDQLSTLVQTTTTLQSNGSSLITVNGRALVNDTIAYHLAPPTVGTDVNGNAQLVIGFTADKNQLNPTPVPLGNGQLGGLVDIYNNKLLPYGQRLDAIASSAVTEINRITESAVDLNRTPGTALFVPAAGQTTITAASITVAISDYSLLPLGLVSTEAGSLVQPLNAGNNAVSTAVPLNGNTTLYNAPAAPGLTGTLTVNVDGTTQTFAYNTATAAPAGNANTIDTFMTSFNAGHFGVTASFDAFKERMIFKRDPNNVDAVHRALQGTSPATPGFMITDSLGPAAGSVPVTEGTPATGLLQTLGALQINGVLQDQHNAYGTADNGAANALLGLYTQKVGVGSLQTTAGAVIANGAGSYTVGPPAGAPAAFATINVGQILTVVDTTALPPTQQTATVSGVNRLTGSVTVTAPSPIALGNSFTTAQLQTIPGAYQALTAQMGLDMSSSKAGVLSQTTLASSIDSARQSVDGINIDEETQNLLKFQSAYSAAAKTLSTLNAMMQTALGLIAGG